jgi:hypothetical protein
MLFAYNLLGYIYITLQRQQLAKDKIKFFIPGGWKVPEPDPDPPK